MKKINIELLKKFIADSHKNCKFCNLKNAICVGKNCTEEIFKSLLEENNSDDTKCGCGSTTNTDVYCQECLTKIAEQGN